MLMGIRERINEEEEERKAHPNPNRTLSRQVSVNSIIGSFPRPHSHIWRQLSHMSEENKEDNNEEGNETGIDFVIGTFPRHHSHVWKTRSSASEKSVEEEKGEEEMESKSSEEDHEKHQLTVSTTLSAETPRPRLGTETGFKLGECAIEEMEKELKKRPAIEEVVEENSAGNHYDRNRESCASTPVPKGGTLKKEHNDETKPSRTVRFQQFFTRKLSNKSNNFFKGSKLSLKMDKRTFFIFLFF